MRRFIRVDPVLDGVFCYYKPVAIGAMKATFEAGFSDPHDVGLVGAGYGHDLDVLLVPLMTMIKKPARLADELPHCSSTRLVRNAHCPSCILLESRPVLRNSTQCVSQTG
jgi:DNA-binding LacI/PurR family transcriptional regulator